MHGEFLVCDGCRTKVEKITGESGSMLPNYWITVSRNFSSPTYHIIQSGQYHFCSEQCIGHWLESVTSEFRKLKGTQPPP